MTVRFAHAVPVDVSRSSVRNEQVIDRLTSAGRRIVRRPYLSITLLLPLFLLLVSLTIWLLMPRTELYPRNGFSTAVLDRNGELLRLGLAPDERYRLPLELEDIEPRLLDAVKIYEDRWFDWHPGFNPAALLRAAWTSYVIRERVVGASTITMQLARLRFDLDTRNIGGKLLQIFRAVQLERHYSKDEILAAYLNLAPYGGNIEGVGAASRIYFNKPADQLSLPELLALVVIPQDPGGRSPLTEAGRTELQLARQRMFALWLEEHPEDASVRALIDIPLHVLGPAALERRAPHFARDVAAEHAREGEVRSSLDLALQGRMERLLSQYLERRKPDGIRNAAMMIVDAESREILVEIGSADFSDDSIAGQVNGARAQRSPGSALKPFIYGLAMEQGLIHPNSLLKDAPKRYGVYTPENFDRGFAGPVTATDALVFSRNVPAVDLLARLQRPDLYDRLVDIGVRDMASREHYGLALALGGNEISMHELLSLYVALANDGHWRPLRELRAPDKAAGMQLMTPEAAFLVIDMLAQAERPDAIPLSGRQRPYRAAWKTGTSYAFRDAWTVGIVGQYAVAVWVGNFDGSGNPALVGLRAAAPLFFDIADTLAAQPDFTSLPEYPGPDLNLREVDICAATGDLPGKHCPQLRQGWFIPGVSPIRVSDVHRAIRIDTVSGLRACWNDANVIVDILAVWPSDIEQVFRQAGYVFRKPPAWHPRCDIGERSNRAAPPEITSPGMNMVYALHPERLEQETIPFQAVADGEARAIFWFVDDAFVGRTAPRETLFWRAAPGRYEIRAVDDLGRISVRELEVGIAQ